MAKKTNTAKTLITKSNVDNKSEEIKATTDKPTSGGDSQNPDSDIKGTISTDNNSLKPIPVIIPYTKGGAVDNELIYAIRSIAKNFEFPISIIVVGDNEDWFSENITHIPHEPHLIAEDCNCIAPKQIQDPQADVAHKLLTALTALDIDGKFILTNDDIFVLDPQNIAQVELLKVLPDSLIKTGSEGSDYYKNAQRTADFLKANNLSLHNYGTHTPMVFDAETFVEMLTQVPTTEKGYLLASLYHNSCTPNARPLVINGSSASETVLGSVYKSNPNMSVIEDAFQKRWYFNCNSDGFMALRPLLEKEFSEKSIYEK